VAQVHVRATRDHKAAQLFSFPLSSLHALFRATLFAPRRRRPASPSGSPHPTSGRSPNSSRRASSPLASRTLSNCSSAPRTRRPNSN